MLSRKVHDYYQLRCFKDASEAAGFFGRTFTRRKILYFDEVENANAWSFYLVSRDLHHTFEEYIAQRGLPPYAVWSRPGREDASDDIGRSTFAISETSTIYRKPVPKAGEAIDYTVEVLEIGSSTATIGFLGYLIDPQGERSLSPSVAAAWLRAFVRYRGEERDLASIPASLRDVLEKNLVGDLQ